MPLPYVSLRKLFRMAPTFLKYELGPPRLFLLPPPEQRPKSDPPPWVIAIATTRSATSSCTPLARNLPSCCCHIHQCDQKSTPPPRGLTFSQTSKMVEDILLLRRTKSQLQPEVGMGWHAIAIAISTNSRGFSLSQGG